MKKIYCLLGFIVCAFYACLEDKGNDVYRELNDVTIERMKDTTVEQFTRLQITPEITVSDGDFNPENYTYLWHMYITYGSNNPHEVRYPIFREGFGCGNYKYTGGILARFRDDG